jgi:hypothetical protein
MYPACGKKLVDFVSLEKITVSLSILEGIFEATPQTVLQTYVYILEYESTGTKLFITIFIKSQCAIQF